jgi:glycosyltransferase involved in cell wall biosynthesis
MPSLWPENSPTVIAESLALGRPVMASNIGGIPEMIIDKKNGWLLTAGKAGVWRDLILDIINNPNQLLSMPSQAQQTAVKFSLEEYKNWLTGLL